jgi:hypothetical protein
LLALADGERDPLLDLLMLEDGDDDTLEESEAEFDILAEVLTLELREADVDDDKLALVELLSDVDNDDDRLALEEALTLVL